MSVLATLLTLWFRLLFPPTLTLSEQGIQSLAPRYVRMYLLIESPSVITATRQGPEPCHWSSAENFGALPIWACTSPCRMAQSSESLLSEGLGEPLKAYAHFFEIRLSQ